MLNKIELSVKIMDMRTESFLRQTAQDYDMDYEDVKWINEKHPDDFYEALEQFIKNRSEMQ